MAPDKIKSLKSKYSTAAGPFMVCQFGVYKSSLAGEVFTFCQREDLTHLLAGHPHFGELPFQPQQPDQVHVAVVVIDVDGQLKGKERAVEI